MLDEEDEVFQWVKAGPPGAKPTIVRESRCNSARTSADGSGSGSSKGIPRSPHLSQNSVLRVEINDSHDSIRTSPKPSSLSPPHVSPPRTPTHLNHQSVTLNPIKITHLNTSPNSRARMRQPHVLHNRVKSAVADDGYTSLSEDYKEPEGIIRTTSLPSYWRPRVNTYTEEPDLKLFSKRLTTNEHKGGDCPLVDFTSEPSCKSKRRTKFDNVVEYCTCFLCLRSVVYNFVEEEDDTSSLVDQPCQCEAPGRECCGRWTLIGLMVIFLPFLIFYPPLKGCINLHQYRMRRRKKKRRKKEQAQRTKKLETLL